ncbi:hypothetical protein ACA910_010132 [Epithemia clementina (nom. ined.)]
MFARSCAVLYWLAVLVASRTSTTAFVVTPKSTTSSLSSTARVVAAFPFPFLNSPTLLRASPTTQPPQKEKRKESAATTTSTKGGDEEETIQKYGLEAGLFKSLQQKDGGESAKSLLKKYGIAYLATSIPLALVSFTLCYVLVDNGIDVASLLSKVGIVALSSDDGGVDVASKAGTFAIAYAAHKAASPLRFPPTVILTPVVAKLIGKEPEEDDDGEQAK